MISRSYRLALVTALFWMLFGAINGLQIQIWMLAHHHFWPLLIGCQILVWSAWIPLSFAVGALVRRVPPVPPRASAVAFHLVAALAFAVFHTGYQVGVELLLKPYDVRNPTDFGSRFGAVSIWQIPLEMLLYGLVLLAAQAVTSAARERERERHAARLETSLAKARLHALELQIQPHFLFNTLN